jgi:hypothetical protein
MFLLGFARLSVRFPVFLVRVGQNLITKTVRSMRTLVRCRTTDDGLKLFRQRGVAHFTQHRSKHLHADDQVVDSKSFVLKTREN